MFKLHNFQVVGRKAPLRTYATTVGKGKKKVKSGLKKKKPSVPWCLIILTFELEIIASTNPATHKHQISQISYAVSNNLL